MKVFNTYLKILYKNKGSISIALMAFCIIAVISVKSNEMSPNLEFEEEEVLVCVINQDEDTVLSDGLKSYLNEHTELLRENEVSNIEDAIFFRQVEYAVVIPEGFFEDFMMGKKPELESYYVENSYSAYYIENLINKYVNTFGMYASAFPEEKPEAAVERTEQVLAGECKVSIENGSMGSEADVWMISFFNSAAYAVLGVVTMGIATVVVRFKQMDVKRRTLCSPISYWKINIRLWAGHGIFGLAVFAALVFVGYLLLGADVFSLRGVYALLNLFVFVLCTMGIAAVIAQFAANSSTIVVISNTLSVCLCFIGGCFVPLQYMSDTAKTIGSFTPTYWYSKAGEVLREVSNFHIGTMKEYFSYLAIQIGFAVAFFSVALLIDKQKSTGKWR